MSTRRRVRGALVTALLAATSGCGSQASTPDDQVSTGGGDGGSRPKSGGSSGSSGGQGSAGAIAGGASGAAESGGAHSAGSSSGGALAGAGGFSETGGSASGGTMAGGGALPGTGGSGGEGTPEACSFAIQGTVSNAIPTVGLVDWSVDLDGVIAARVDFDLVEPEPFELNVQSGGPIDESASSAWLLGLKPEREYAYRITVQTAQTTCVSPDHFLTTGALSKPPTITRTTGPALDTQEVGFVINCGYGTGEAAIIDADGEVVWSFAPPPDCSRAHMDWEGRYMWMMNANPSTGASAGARNGEVIRVRMDGTGREVISGFERAHHDFTALPGGTMAFLVVVEDDDTGVVERAPDGTLSTVVVLNDGSYLSGGTATHPNALHYWAHDDSYTVSDLGVSSVINFDREGIAQWQVGGSCTDPIEECETMHLVGAHGHHFLDNGNLVVFLAGIGSNNMTMPDPVVEYRFDGPMSSANASLDWLYLSTERSFIFGDVRRLANGNTLITYSQTGVIEEVTRDEELVQTLTSSRSFGYSSFRKTLYGPPQ